MGWWILSFGLMAMETWGSVYFFDIFMERKRKGWLDKCRYVVLYFCCVPVGILGGSLDLMGVKVLLIDNILNSRDALYAKASAGEWEDDLFRQEPSGGKSPDCRWHCTGFYAKNQKGIGRANMSVKSDKEIEEIIYESGICVRGMIMNGKSEAEMHRMINVSEEYRQKMFDECKRHFLQENGVANGDTTKRSEVFRAYQLSVKENDRLKGTWSLQQYEKQYTAALAAAVRTANPNWKNGDPFDAEIYCSMMRLLWLMLCSLMHSAIKTTWYQPL